MCWCSPGGLSKLSSDPVQMVNDAVEESTHLLGAVMKFAANLIAPEEDQGSETLLGFIQQAVTTCIMLLLFQS